MAPTLRVVTVNLWTDHQNVNMRMQVIINWLKALRADVVAMQEVIGDSPSGLNQAAQIAKAIDGHWQFDHVGTAENGTKVGNAIVSRFPIEGHQSLLLPSDTEDPRRALLCKVRTPTGMLPFVTTHLSWEMWHAGKREKQVVALDEFVRAHPSDLPPIITGDFNSSPDTSAIAFMTGKMSLGGKSTYYRDCWQRRHATERGATWSEQNPNTVLWIERNRRLDYIFVGQIREDGWGAVLDCRVVLDMTGPDGNFPSDHFGLYSEIGVAPADRAV